MSPEQARGMPVDHRADIYAVGVMLYRMLTGVTPFERDSPQETLLAVLAEEAPSPRFVEPAIPEQLEAIILRAMAKEPTHRYQWIAELSHALAPYDFSRSPAAIDSAPQAMALQQAAQIQAPAATQPAAIEPAGGGAWIVMAMLLGVPALLMGLLLALIGLLQAGGLELNSTVWVLTTVLLLLALSTPLVLVVRGVMSAWRDPARRAPLGQGMRAALFTMSALYTLGSLALRFAEVAELDIPNLGTAYDSILFACVALAGLIAYLVKRKP
jgi:serine/threonine-protein kinase